MEILRRNGPLVKSVESVLRLEGRIWWERLVKEVSHVKLTASVISSQREATAQTSANWVRQTVAKLFK